jgi:hypothetical protein
VPQNLGGRFKKNECESSMIAETILLQAPYAIVQRVCQRLSGAPAQHLIFTTADCSSFQAAISLFT